MKNFGTVKMFDNAKGFGSIQPESGGDELRFESSAVKWDSTTSPAIDQRLSYELGKNGDGTPCAVNLHAI